MSQAIYERPLYYDIAFTWDLTREIEFFGEVFAEHVAFPVRRILEPACGTGRFLLALPRHGYRVVGYDASRLMVDYARARISNAGDPGRARVVVDDMRSARFGREFDAALNSINSLGYLLEDDEIVRHFQNTAASIKRGGVYIVHLSCAWRGEPDLEHNTWEFERDGVRVRTKWTVEREDRESKRSLELCTMEIEDGGQRISLVDRHELRLWFYEDLRALVDRSGALELAAVYAEDFARLPISTDITGELGNLYYVLKVG